MKILGISAFYHDSAACILIDGEVMAAVQEERFTRKKHDPSFPVHSIKYCLDHSGLDIADLDAVAFYDKPFLKFERLLETYYNFAPKGILSFVKAIPIWVKEKLFLKKVIKDELYQISPFPKNKLKLLFPEHHLSHAASAFYPSGLEEAAILTVDGVGEWATASISHGERGNIKLIKELHFPHSIGLLYSAFTYFLGFKVNTGEYKLMGLAPYGNPQSPDIGRYIQIIESTLVDIKEDGSIWVNQDYFNYATGLRMVRDDQWENLFGFPRRSPESELKQHHCDLGLAIQKVTERVLIKMSREAKRVTGCQNLCMAGGVALNCVANGKIQKEAIFEQLFIQPAAGDAGGALGAALAAYHITFGKERKNLTKDKDDMKGAFLGPEYTDLDIEKTARKYKATFQKIAKEEDLLQWTAQKISEGNIIGWFQGRMEFGPRALGARSILGDPRNPEMQKKINLKIKFRESFRPFAPSILAEDCSSFFNYEGRSPYMLLVHGVKEEIRNLIPKNYNSLPIKEKLYIQRSKLPAITHIDFSARIQTVHPDTNPRYYALLKALKSITGIGMTINTSFNVRGEPIVCTPDDAFKCFINTEMDYLVIGNYVFDRKEQQSKNLMQISPTFEFD